jgi:hypothetical protein
MADSEFQAEPPEEKPDKVRPARPKPRPRPRDDEDDYDDPGRFRQKDAVESLIPYKNPQGLMAYYAGVFALIPCVGLILGPAAFILGILGIRYANKYPTAGGKGHAIAGVVLGTLVVLGHLAAVVFFALIGFLGK